MQQILIIVLDAVTREEHFRGFRATESGAAIQAHISWSAGIKKAKKIPKLIRV